jgi:hypothetical protein
MFQLSVFGNDPQDLDRISDRGPGSKLRPFISVNHEL